MLIQSTVAKLQAEDEHLSVAKFEVTHEHLIVVAKLEHLMSMII